MIIATLDLLLNLLRVPRTLQRISVRPLRPERLVRHRRRRNVATAVVYQDRRIARDHIVRVDVVDGEVVDLRRLRPLPGRADLHVGAGRGTQPLARRRLASHSTG